LTATPLVPWQSRRLSGYPFVDDRLQFYFWLVGGGLAIALGFRQTAWELGQGTYFYLLHRPVSRHLIFTFKLLVGGALMMLVAGLLVALYAWWATTPGSFSAPYFWTMTLPAWQMWLSLPPIYFGAFLSGVRPGHWFGTRLAPLVAGILASVVANHAAWLLLVGALSLAASAFLIVGIFYYIQQRDY
jgi:ABC-type transport system involved in multi-copper enzyme maturation permease subunit